MMNTLICLSWRFPIRKGYQPIWGFCEHPSSPRFPPCPTTSIGPIREQADRTTSDSIGPGRITLAFSNSKMRRSFCLQLLFIFLPFSLPKSLHSGTSGTPGQDSCKYWGSISEIYYKLNTTSTPEEFNLLLELKDKTLLKSNLAAFRTISEKFINVSNVVSSISKNLDYLEELLQTLTMPTPTSQREVHIEAEDFNEYSEKLLVFLEALDDFLKPLLKCPETFKASRRKP
ncbi:uncharacterized protein LOC131515057 [Neofelis nebulosa]|uniref:uncharacterized protein LOC131515057 n=1 Tax=Neofelis nebulosa TaxID=61452 RepID=UPI00272A49FE|nr:uncharacterized protein LOC131515057 [Neofelis nebulosa]